MENTCIKPLKGPDRVRKRVGSNGTNGVLNAIKMLLDIFSNEARIGKCSGIDFTIHADNSISIHSHDRGIIIDEAIVDGKPAWHNVFCELFSTATNSNDKFQYPLEQENNRSLYAEDEQTPSNKITDDYGFKLCCVQYASEFMNVDVVRDSTKKSLVFKEGYSVGELQVQKTDEKSGTHIHFMPDSKVFGENIDLTNEAFAKLLANIKHEYPALECNFIDKRIS